MRRACLLPEHKLLWANKCNRLSADSDLRMEDGKLESLMQGRLAPHMGSIKQDEPHHTAVHIGTRRPSLSASWTDKVQTYFQLRGQQPGQYY